MDRCATRSGSKSTPEKYSYRDSGSTFYNRINTCYRAGEYKSENSFTSGNRYHFTRKGDGRDGYAAPTHEVLCSPGRPYLHFLRTRGTHGLPEGRASCHRATRAGSSGCDGN